MRGRVVEDVADAIAFEIASGRLAPGESLPSIRRLAARYEINPSTVQLVLGRLRTAGFVEPRQGVGVVVRDIQLVGGIETWRYVFRLSQGLPELTVSTVRDALETLRIFYETFHARIVAHPGKFDPGPARGALRRLELLAAGERPAPGDVHRGVLAVLRAGLLAFGGGVTLAVLNSLGEMLGEIPEVMTALYADPAEHVWFWDQVITSWENGDAELGRQALDMLTDWHEVALDRLRAGLATP